MAVGTVLMDWVIIDVQTSGPDAVHVKVPFPLVIADVATAFIPDEAMEEMEVPAELRDQREAVLGGVRALLEAPDGVYVKVDSEDARVVVAKERDDLRIAVDADDAVVRCVVPIDGVLEALEKWDWQTFDPGMVLDVLDEAGNGNLVTVEAEGTRVAVNLW